MSDARDVGQDVHWPDNSATPKTFLFFGDIQFMKYTADALGNFAATGFIAISDEYRAPAAAKVLRLPRQFQTRRP